MPKFLLIFILFIFSFSKSQQINVILKDEQGNSTENVNVQLLKNGNILEFKRSNKEGVSVFNISENGIYTIKLTSVYYKTEVFELDTREKTSFTFIVKQQITEIESVEIKSRPRIASAKEDTISFNIKAIKDGTERTAEDLIKKMPGLSINENGKISYNGNNIGQVLIDGNEFFGGNHKMATQNISADMLEGIDLWQNYTTINGNRSSALNLKLKDKYKGKISGNIEGNYGLNDNYLGHANLFKFNKIGNLALILDANNIAKDPISFMDFYEMNTQNQIDNASESTSNIDVPSFLNNDGKVKSKDNQFSALQFSKTSRKYSITAYSILNAAQLTKANLTERIAFQNQPDTYNFLENRTENNKGLFGITQIKARYNLSENTFFYYNLGYNSTNDRFNQNTDRAFSDVDNTIEIKNQSKSYHFNNYLSFNTLLGKNTKAILDFSQNNSSVNKDLTFNSNIGLFGNTFNYLHQNFILDSQQYSINFYLKNKNKYLNFNFQSGFTYRNSESVNDNSLLNINDKQKIDSYNYINSINISKQIQTWDLSASLDWHNLILNQENQNYFEKKAKIKFSPDTNTTQEYSFEYRDRYENPSLILLQDNPIFDKNLSYSINGNLLSNELSHYNSYKFTYRRFNLRKGNNWLIILLYDNTTDVFTTNGINYGTYSVYENIFGKMKDRWLGLLSNETPIKSYLSLKTKLSAMKSDSDNYIQGNENKTEIQNFEINQQLSTNFKKFPVQFDLGYIYNRNKFKQKYYLTESSQENLRILSGIRMNIKKEFIISILGEYLKQKTAIQLQKNFLVGGQLSYKKEHSNMEFNVRFNNLFNLNNFNYINNRVTEMGTEYSNLAALNGYVVGGMKYNF